MPEYRSWYHHCDHGLFPLLTTLRAGAQDAGHRGAGCGLGRKRCVRCPRTILAGSAPDIGLYPL